MKDNHSNLLNETLRKKAVEHKNELSQHPILKKYWDSLTLILKGSTARGYSDSYSDIDFVLFMEEDTKKKIVSDYIASGRSQRTNGLFFPLRNGEGHCNLDTYAQLEQHFQQLHVMNIWEYSNVILLHDANNRYSEIRSTGMDFFKNHMEDVIRQTYLNYQLNLDWMQQPLRRQDKNAVLLYASSVFRIGCQLLFLLCDQPYPCDKWLFFYFDRLDIAEEIKTFLNHYSAIFPTFEKIVPDCNVMEYPLYSYATEMIEKIKILLVERYGHQQWILEWYLYA